MKVKSKKSTGKKSLRNLGIIIGILIILGIIGNALPDSKPESVNQTNQTESSSNSEVVTTSGLTADNQINQTETSNQENSQQTSTQQQISQQSSFDGYKLITVDGGNMSGSRQANVVVDIGFGDREYWAFTNEYGQLVRVIADEIILQDGDTEPVKSNGRYYNDEADVPGTEQDDLDEGHIIADSLGGVSNAYNITPQDSTLNRHGDQAYMERNILDAGGATNFEAIITYPDTKTQIPSHYHYTYALKGNVITEDFDNVNPDEVNKALIEAEKKNETPAPAQTPEPVSETPSVTNTTNDISAIDTNGNGKVTIQEAKDAGFKMPVYSDHWLYQYMDDRDGDGMVGE